MRALVDMRVLKSFATASAVIGRIQLAEKLKKGQCKTGKLDGRTAAMPETWWKSFP